MNLIFTLTCGLHKLLRLLKKVLYQQKRRRNQKSKSHKLGNNSHSWRDQTLLVKMTFRPLLRPLSDIKSSRKRQSFIHSYNQQQVCHSTSYGEATNKFEEKSKYHNQCLDWDLWEIKSPWIYVSQQYLYRMDLFNTKAFKKLTDRMWIFFQMLCYRFVHIPTSYSTTLFTYTSFNSLDVSPTCNITRGQRIAETTLKKCKWWHFL